MDYKEQIKHPKWQKKRLEILERDSYTCLECGEKEKTLHVHHNYYTSIFKLWEYSNEHLQTLCEDCHSERHHLKSLIKEVIDVWFTDNKTLQELHCIITKLYPLNVKTLRGISIINENFINDQLTQEIDVIKNSLID